MGLSVEIYWEDDWPLLELLCEATSAYSMASAHQVVNQSMHSLSNITLDLALESLLCIHVPVSFFSCRHSLPL